MKRQLLKIKISDKITNEKLRKKKKLVNVRVKIQELKWNWAGHFQRHTDEIDGRRMAKEAEENQN